MKQLVILVFFIALQAFPINILAQNESERYKKGWVKLKQIDGHAGESVINTLSDISPELGDYIIEYLFGDVYGREDISDKEREIAVIASLTALGNAAPQLKVHLHAALNTGNTPIEVIQVIIQTAPYSGLPASLNALKIFREVLKERGIDYKAPKQTATIYEDEIEKGKQKLNSLSQNQYQKLTNNLDDVAPELAEYITYTYGFLLNEDALKTKNRLIAIIAALTAKGTAPLNLKFYIKAAIHVGIAPEKIREIMITMSGYAGFPAAINGILVLKEVLQELNLTIKIK